MIPRPRGAVLRTVALALSLTIIGPAAVTPDASPASSSVRGAAPVTGSSVIAASHATLVVATSRVPAFDHIYLIVMENHELGAIVGNRSAPYINALIRRYGLATNLTAVAHPSQPNYLALFAGSTFGIRDDGFHRLTARNLVDQLEAHGKTWQVFAQDIPGICSQAVGYPGPVDLAGLPGWYARKHEPAITFNDIAGSSRRCSRITPLSGFTATAANLELIVPNMSNDMHDGTIAQGDAFLRAFVPRITSSPAFANSLLIITWDEGSTKIGGGGRVATLVISPHVRRGFRSGVAHTHYSILRTIENAWGLGCLNQACHANDLREFFTQ